jgi:hypothetical protein
MYKYIVVFINMNGENVTIQNFMDRVLQGKIFTYKLKILEEIKCLYMSRT